MFPFKAPVDDILFSLRDVAGASSLPDWDDDLASDIIATFAQFSEGVIAPLNAAGDAQGCRFENGRVRMPDGFADAFDQLADMGWQGLTAPEDFGGMAQSPVIAAMVSEVFSGANHAMQMVCNLVPGAISTLMRFGTSDQQATWIPKLASGAALSTMCLTEPGAGSDLSRVRTRAVQSGEHWVLNGEKIFISGGDQDLSQDILHVVLARTGAVDAGVKGLSLFITGKSQAGSTLKVTRIEQKLGLHASPTCHIVLDDTPAELIGVEGEGLKAMFTLMNHARIDVALQGVAHASRAHAISLAYASDRKQGRRADGSAAVLSDHADVRRMLDQQRRLTLTGRALAHLTCVEAEHGNTALVDFLTPICKVYCTQAGLTAADIGIQILGGYGYLTEYGVDQIWRDARITSIYEGANGIHELATATRGLQLSGGAGADAFEAWITSLIQDDEGPALLGRWRKARAILASSDDPASLAHDFMAITTSVLEAIIINLIATKSDDADIKRIADSFSADPRF